MFRTNTAQRVAVRLYTPAGTPATGIVPADVKGGVARVVTPSGSVVGVTLTAGVNWFEIDATNIPGLYHIALTAGNLNVTGPIQVAITPDAAAFLGVIVSSFAETVGVDAALARKVAAGRWKVHTTGPDADRLVLYDDDGVTVLYKFNLFNIAGNQSSTNPYERVPTP